jgi:hypothetical protein
MSNGFESNGLTNTLSEVFQASGENRPQVLTGPYLRLDIVRLMSTLTARSAFREDAAKGGPASLR